MDKDEIIKALATALVDVTDGLDAGEIVSLSGLSQDEADKIILARELALSLLGGGPISKKATTKGAESACNRKRMFA